MYLGLKISKGKESRSPWTVWLVPTHASVPVPNVSQATVSVASKSMTTLVARLGKKSCV